MLDCNLPLTKETVDIEQIENKVDKDKIVGYSSSLTCIIFVLDFLEGVMDFLDTVNISDATATNVTEKRSKETDFDQNLSDYKVIKPFVICTIERPNRFNC